MNQLRLDLDLHDGARYPGYTWERSDASLSQNCGQAYRLVVDGLPTEWLAVHCGHPTALWPYYANTPVQTDLEGRTFTHLAEIQEHIITAFEGATTP